MVVSVRILRSGLILLSVFLSMVGISLAVRANYVVAVSLYYGIPALLLSVGRPQAVRNALAFSISFAIPSTLILDYIGHVTGTWQESSITGIRVFGAFPIEAIFWAVTFVYFVTIAFEYAFPAVISVHVPSTYRSRFILILSALLSCFLIILWKHSEWLVIPHFYLILVLFFIGSVVVVVWKRRELLPQLLQIGVFFFVYQLIYELSALALGHWSFPGDNRYVGWVHLLGFRFPLEELFWMIAAVPSVICLYQLYGTSKRNQTSSTF